jgi:hypothetical protein
MENANACPRTARAPQQPARATGPQRAAFGRRAGRLHEEARQIEAQLKLEEATPDNNLVDGVNLAIERFEADHPDLTATLRSIVNSLHSMGI